MNDADRYIWAISNLSLLVQEAKLWSPGKSSDPRKFLQRFIDSELSKTSPEWLAKQREALND